MACIRAGVNSIRILLSFLVFIDSRQECFPFLQDLRDFSCDEFAAMIECTFEFWQAEIYRHYLSCPAETLCIFTDGFVEQGRLPTARRTKDYYAATTL